MMDRFPGRSCADDAAEGVIINAIENVTANFAPVARRIVCQHIARLGDMLAHDIACLRDVLTRDDRAIAVALLGALDHYEYERFVMKGGRVGLIIDPDEMSESLRAMINSILEESVDVEALPSDIADIVSSELNEEDVCFALRAALEPIAKPLDDEA